MDRSNWRIVTRPGHPDFLDRPWGQPLEQWPERAFVEVARGLHRHVVKFVAQTLAPRAERASDPGRHGRDAIYAFKELPRRAAEREYRLLRQLAHHELPVVDAVGLVERAEDLGDVLITRYLDFSLPYRHLFIHRRAGFGDPRGLADRLLDALALLLVRLHVAGFFWGDCSLSNTLFRRDAGALAAYCVDLETGEWHARLTDGQREADLEVTELNVAGGLLDVQAELGLTDDLDPRATAEGLRRRYAHLWDELTSDVLIRPGEQYKIEARMRRLNQLGFDVDEVELVRSGDAGSGPAGVGVKVALRTVVTEQGHHRRQLLSLVGLEAQENQARSLLNDIANFRGAVERHEGRAIPLSVAAYRWLSEIFEPAVAAIPATLGSKLEPVEVFHGVIQHKWYLSERAGTDVGIDAAVSAYMDQVLPEVPDERLVLAGADPTEDEATGPRGALGCA